jgi:uncharacterized protein
MKAVLFYETGDVPMEKIREIFPRHKVLLDEFHSRGELLAVGTWANPREGSMGVFRDRGSAEAFVKRDPFVLECVVGKITIRDWNESLMG